MTKRNTTKARAALLSLPAAAKRLGLTREAVRKLIDRGMLEAVPFGGETRRHLRILRRSVEALLKGGNGHHAA